MHSLQKHCTCSTRFDLRCVALVLFALLLLLGLVGLSTGPEWWGAARIPPGWCENVRSTTEGHDDPVRLTPALINPV